MRPNEHRVFKYLANLLPTVGQDNISPVTWELATSRAASSSLTCMSFEIHPSLASGSQIPRTRPIPASSMPAWASLLSPWLGASSRAQATLWKASRARREPRKVFIACVWRVVRGDVEETKLMTRRGAGGQSAPCAAGNCRVLPYFVCLLAVMMRLTFLPFFG